MKFEYLSKKGRLYFEGNELLKYRIEVPRFEEFEGCEEINTFYSEIMSECERFCKETLFLKLCEDRNDKKHIYLLSAIVTHCDDEMICVVIFVTLKVDGSRFFEFKHSNLWGCRDGVAITPKMLLKRYGQKGKNKYKSPFLNRGRLEELESTYPEDIFSQRQEKVK